MSVSMKDRKAVIYAELERFRALCDRQEQQLRAAAQDKPTVDKPGRSWLPSGTNFARFAPDACKHFNKRSVTREEILDYLSEVCA